MGYTPNTWRPMDVITSKKLNDLEQGLTQTSDNVVYGMGGATQSSDGIHSLAYINKGDALPNNPQVGDTIFMKDGDDFSILEWDGEQWNTRVDPKLSDRIQTALDEAKDNTQTLINNNNESINEMMDQVTKDKIAAALKDADFNAKAQAIADKALSDAKSNTATVAQQTLNSANQNLSAAKTDLTNSIASEASARNAAVAAANSQAQTYANQAKSDALNTIAQEVTDRQNAVNALDTKTTNAVNQAKSDINDTINAISVGGRNLLLGTGRSISGVGLNKPNLDLTNPQTGTYYLAGGKKVSDLYNQYGQSGYLTISFDWVASGDTISGAFNAMWNQSPWSGLSQSGSIKPSATNKSGHYVSTVPLNFSVTGEYSMGTATGVKFRQDNLQGNITISNLKLEAGNKATDWTAAPEDIVLDYTTKDNQIRTTITQYQETNDGKVSKAQADATIALGRIETKVSKTDYDQKTGDLATKINDVKQTADGSTQAISDIRAADGRQDSRMAEIENSATALKSTVSDLSTIQGKQSGYISTLQQKADGWDATVTKVDNLAVGGTNLLQSTSRLLQSKTINTGTGWGDTNRYQDIPISVGQNYTFKVWLQCSTKNVLAHVKWLNSSKSEISEINGNQISLGDTGGYSTVTGKAPTNAIYARVETIRFPQNNGASGDIISYKEEKFEIGTLPTAWSPAPEDLSAATAKAQLTADNAALSLSQYQTTADGRISRAEADIKANTNSITQKVSQTDYNTKTGQLQTDLNTTTTTANQAKTDIASIKSDNTKQDARMTTIENDANGTKTTVSNLQTDLGKANGSITTLQQRADGFDATVTKINTTVNSLGQINQLFNTEFSPDFQGWTAGSNPTNANPVTTEFTLMGTDGFGSNVVSHKGGGNWINSAPITVTAGMALSFSSRISVPKTSISGVPIALYIMAYNATNARVLSRGYNIPNNQLTSTPTTFKIENIVMPSGSVKAFAVYAWNVSDEVYISQPMLVFSDHVGTYVQGNYNNNSATAKAQLTADQATLSINNYKTDADGRISKAQADIKANANSITQKVSQADYDKKTGDLSTKINTAQSTADSATRTIGAYKTSNDARVASAESKITANANAITQKVSQTDYNQKTGELSQNISTLQQRADGFDSTVTKVNNLSVGDRNYILDTGNPKTQTSNGKDNQDMRGSAVFYSPIKNWGVVNGDYIISFDWTLKTALSSDMQASVFFDQSPWQQQNFTVKSGQLTGHVNLKFKLWSTILTASQDVAGLTFRIMSQMASRNTITYSNLFMKSGTISTTWSPAPEDTDNKISTVSQKVDSITSIVSDPNTGLSTRVQTAEGALSKVQGTDIPALQKATFWQPYSSLNFNDYTKQGSFFFNTTTAKTNGPTTSKSWIYLIVEQGTADNSRIKQIAWYDGTNGVKITYVRTLNSGTWSPWYANDNDSVTTISQTNSSIKQEIADRKTGDNNTLQSSKNFTTSSITSYDKGIQSTIAQTASGILAQVESTNMVVNSEFDPLNGTWYTLSGSGATGSTVGAAWNAPVATSFADWPVVNGSRIISYAVGTWYTSALVTASAGKVFSASIVAGRNPAPKVSTALDYRIGFWDSSRKLLTTASAGNIIDGTAYKGIQKYVVENKTSPANTAFVSVIIAHSSANAIDFITRPSLNTGVKASPYTPTYGNTSSSTILSLFKDNWSIGIKDNQSALTSGLFGDINGMTLNGKTVTINANTTNITGTAWIKSAMIANAAIQTVNIADAAITSAKIAQLDVAKLTGNVSSFIQSNWNGQFGSTTIDSTGMQVVSGKAKTKFGDGSMSIISALGENIGWIGRQVDSTYSNLDFLTIGLNGWQTTAPGDAHYDKNPNSPDDFYGGDGIIFGISTVGGGYLPLLMYNTPLAASYRSGIAGWMFTQPIVGGLDVFGDNMRASNTVAWRFKNINTRGFTYPFLTSKQADDANVKTGMLLGSGTMYFYGGNKAVLSVKENGYGYYEAKKFGSGGSALYMAGDGALIAHSSATKYKTNIDRNVGKELSEKLLTVDLASWNDKDEDRQLQEYYETGKPTDYAIDMDGAKYYGLIAEDLVKADLEEFVVRNTITGSVESIQYDKIGVAWIPLVRDLRNQVNELKFEIEKIKESMK